MDLSVFLSELHKCLDTMTAGCVEGLWVLDSGVPGTTGCLERCEMIRLDETRGDLDAGSHCPITAVAFRLTGESHPTMYFERAARRIGLDRELATQIAEAADGSGDSVIRKALCQALGLE